MALLADKTWRNNDKALGTAARLVSEIYALLGSALMDSLPAGLRVAGRQTRVDTD
jgi:hypothetical protein